MMDITIDFANETTLVLAALLSMGISVGLFAGYMRFKAHAKDTLCVVAAAAILFGCYMTELVFSYSLMAVGMQRQSPWIAFSAFAAHLVSAYLLSATIVLTVLIVKEWPHSRSVRHVLEIDI